MRMQAKVFRFGPHTLALTVPQGSVVASMDEDEMLKVMENVTSNAELAGAVSYLIQWEETTECTWEHHQNLLPGGNGPQKLKNDLKNHC